MAFRNVQMIEGTEMEGDDAEAILMKAHKDNNVVSRCAQQRALALLSSSVLCVWISFLSESALTARARGAGPVQQRRSVLEPR
eukprot:3795474-Rhodomonas_salina.1